MKKAKRIIASFLAVLVLAAIMLAPTALALRQIIGQTNGLRVQATFNGNYTSARVTVAQEPFARNVTAQVVGERYNGTTVGSARTGLYVAVASIHLDMVVTATYRGWLS